MDTKRRAKEVAAACAIVLIAMAPWLTHGRLPWNDGCVVWVFDVGQGDGIFLDCPGGQVVIDGGPSGDFIEHLTRVMPPWDRTINLVINTHPHADHYVGLIDVLKRYDVGEVWVSGQGSASSGYDEFEKRAGDRTLSVHAGDGIDLGEGIRLRVIYPIQPYDGAFLDDPNDGSVAVVLEQGDTSMVFMGDLGVEQEFAIMDQVGDIDVLKIGHHGSLTSSDPMFLQAIDPELAIISVGENSYGHPHPVVLDRLAQLGIQVMRTDLAGSVRVDLGD